MDRNKETEPEPTPEAWDELLAGIPLERPESFGPIDSPDVPVNEFGEIDEDFVYEEPPLDDRAIEEQNYFMLRQQKVFRMAADYFAFEASKFDWVTKVALFGSVARPLGKEVPRFRQYRSARVKVWHECRDVDIAVWVKHTDDLNVLRKATSQAVNRLRMNTNHLATPAHHQLDVHLMAAHTDAYLGRLCIFKSCPKEGKSECFVPGCGVSKFLQQFEAYTFDPAALTGPTTRILWECGVWYDDVPF